MKKRFGILFDAANMMAEGRKIDLVEHGTVRAVEKLR